jgi:RimJ/RimL family protein N-acetyltransferase
MLIRLEKFSKEHYKDLISWVDSEETLMQFAGPGFKFPLTEEQLDISVSDANRIAFRIINAVTNISIGHAEIYSAGELVKMGRILIGDPAQRGKGLGRQIVNLLLEHVFFKLEKTMVELNVFDWNASAIRCYENAGFTINPDKKLERKVKNNVWIAINMTIDKKKWTELQTAL